MKKLSNLIMGFLFFVGVDTLYAGNLEQGKKLSAQCQMCHGRNGISINTIIPNLAGQKKGYLLKAMDDFKEKRRRNKIMDRLFEKLDKSAMADLATFYSKLNCR
jgi:cytochrome c553